jgi:hypothetical protein
MFQRRPSKFRRRNFFIKHGFQTRFALYPLGFLALFLLGAGVYLRVNLEEILRFHLYLPHSRLENPWEEVLPVLARTVAWGGGAFLGALGLWGWRRFGRLRKDMNHVADWMNRLTCEEEVSSPPGMGDAEVRALAEALYTAAESFAAWDREIEGRARSFALAVADLNDAVSAGSTPELAAVRSAFQELRDTVARVKVNEELS